MNQHWKSLLVVLVIIGTIVLFYRGDKLSPDAAGGSTISHDQTNTPSTPVEPVHAAPTTHEVSSPAPSSAPVTTVAANSPVVTEPTASTQQDSTAPATVPSPIQQTTPAETHASVASEAAPQVSTPSDSSNTHDNHSVLSQDAVKSDVTISTQPISITQ